MNIYLDQICWQKKIKGTIQYSGRMVKTKAFREKQPVFSAKDGTVKITNFAWLSAIG